METKDIFEETGKLGQQIIKEKRVIDKLNLKCMAMMEMCPHEIVFNFHDNHPRLMPTAGTFFCPACGKAYQNLIPSQLETFPFRHSRIIELPNISLIPTKDVLFAIRSEVYNNIELYYNHNLSNDELSGKMESIMADKQYDYYSSKAIKK